MIQIFFPFLSPQKSSGKLQNWELGVMSVFPAPLKEFLKVAAKSPVPVVEPVIAADLQLEVCHEDTALVFSDFSTVCNVLLEAHAIPGHNQRCFFMTGIGEYPTWLILSQWAPQVRVVYKEVARTDQVYTRSVLFDNER